MVVVFVVFSNKHYCCDGNRYDSDSKADVLNMPCLRSSQPF
jgi:hypothetical protein